MYNDEFGSVSGKLTVFSTSFIKFSSVTAHKIRKTILLIYGTIEIKQSIDFYFNACLFATNRN